MSKRWEDELAPGRVFELRSTSKRYPAPCALVVRSQDERDGGKQVTEVDGSGVIGQGLYHRPSNPRIYVDGLSGVQLAKRITRRRRDLERFDRDDLCLIRHGYAIDFDGCIRGCCLEMSGVPLTPAVWTLFWLPASGERDWWYPPRFCERKYLRGAWYFINRGGARHLGYKYERLWATRHQGKRLDAFRKALREMRPDVIEQECRVVRYREDGWTVTTELRRPCPALGHPAIHQISDDKSAWWSLTR